jgi:hypothetical protein
MASKNAADDTGHDDRKADEDACGARSADVCPERKDEDRDDQLATSDAWHAAD